MAIERQRLRRLLYRGIPIAAVIMAFLVALLLVSDLEQVDESPLHFMWVVAITGLALIAMLAIITHRIFRLTRKVRAQEPGARLSARWVRNFLALSLPPVLIVYGFSTYFLTRTVDSWFDVQVETALADSLALGQEFLGTRTLEVRNQLRRLLREIEGLDDDEELLRRALLGQVSNAGPVELSVLEQNGHVLATASINVLADLNSRPGDYALMRAQQGGEYAAAEPAPGRGLQIRVIQQMASIVPAQPDLLVQAIYPLPDNIIELTENIEQEYYRYQNVSYLRNSLKQSFVLILSLVLLLTVFIAILAALDSARRMVSPISRLAKATRQVASGELGHGVDVTSRDEIGFLAQSFNEMTEALMAASHAAESARMRLKSQGDYLETVLGNLSAGVLTLDQSGQIVRINLAAKQILDLAEGEVINQPVANISKDDGTLARFSEHIITQVQGKVSEWQQEIQLSRNSGLQILLIRGTPLPPVEDENSGVVIVFDDVTLLTQAQRDAAWSEVARRMAHEVKNPLTPIRLAAERLRMKLSASLADDESRLLDRATDTIVAQVEALRTLVDAFSEYARQPELQLHKLRLDELITDVTNLYVQGYPELHFELDLVPGPEGLLADSGRLRQLLHNLIRNACEAVPSDAHAHILIRSRPGEDPALRELVLEIIDNGPGFPAEVLSQPFEPYLTRKPNGTGLGLAICRKIVDEHHGQIHIQNTPAGGAHVLIRLPLTEASQA